MKELKKRIELLQKQIQTFPRGTITKKNINGVIRTYLQWRDNLGKTRTLYIKQNEIQMYEEQVEIRKELEKQLKKEMELYNVIKNYNLSITLDNEFYTNILYGYKLLFIKAKVQKFNKRYCFKKIMNYLNDDTYGKVCILYGLRRTGKTTLIFQAINELPEDQTAYIKITSQDTMSDLVKDLNKLYEKGYKYIFIDEITLLEDFINTAAVLSDVFCMMNMKIVLSGTDSLGFNIANEDELYDRNIMIHTSYISFKEYNYLLGIDSIDKYIEYGGTLRIENMRYDDEDYFEEEVSFRDDESTRKYIDSAISRNIQNSLKNYSAGKYFNSLIEPYHNNELTNIINRIIEDFNHNFVIEVIEQKFKSHDLGSAKQLLLHDAPDPKSHVLYEIDYEQLLSKLKTLLEIKEKEQLNTIITKKHLYQIKQYLYRLDLIKDYSVLYSNGEKENKILFIQVGMRYSIVKALVYSLIQDKYFANININDKTYIINKILEDVKGKLLEEIIILDINNRNNKNIKAFKYKFDIGEVDLIIQNTNTNTCEIYEIKHSNKISFAKQTKNLLNENKCKIIENQIGKIVKKGVLYRGETQKVNNIEYINIEEYLKQ